MALTTEQVLTATDALVFHPEDARLGDAAALTHTVETVYIRDGDRLLAVHEHLSPAPAGKTPAGKTTA